MLIQIIGFAPLVVVISLGRLIMTPQEWIETIRHILKTRSPATAYRYMEDHGGISSYPFYLVADIRAAIKVKMAHPPAVSSRVAAEGDFVAPDAQYIS